MKFAGKEIWFFLEQKSTAKSTAENAKQRAGAVEPDPECAMLRCAGELYWLSRMINTIPGRRVAMLELFSLRAATVVL
jgi:hypothetical protein